MSTSDESSTTLRDWDNNDDGVYSIGLVSCSNAPEISYPLLATACTTTIEAAVPTAMAGNPGVNLGGFCPGVVRPPEQCGMMAHVTACVTARDLGWFGGYVHVETRIMMMDRCDKQDEQMS